MLFENVKGHIWSIPNRSGLRAHIYVLVAAQLCLIAIKGETLKAFETNTYHTVLNDIALNHSNSAKRRSLG